MTMDEHVLVQVECRRRTRLAVGLPVDRLLLSALG